MTTADHFSPVAYAYRQFRPSYPAALFDWLNGQLKPAWSAQNGGYRRAPTDTPVIWDVGCGSGQASAAMAGRGWQVLASDISLTQLTNARAADPAIARCAGNNAAHYFAASAEAAPLANGSVDAITVAQAAHWFNLPAFYQQARRVLTPSGLLALFSYGRPALQHAPANAVLQHFHRHTLGPWWPAERALVDNGYRHLHFPYPRLATPALHIQRRWTLSQLLGYAASWSATARCTQAGHKPIEQLERQLLPQWPVNADRQVVVQWPLAILASRPNDAAG